MKRLSALIATLTVVLTVFAAAASPAGPPSVLGRFELKPLPKAGAVSFFEVTAKGKLAAGKATPSTAYVELSGSTIPPGMAVGGVALKPAVAGGSATLTFLFAVDHAKVKKFARDGKRRDAGGDALDLIVIGAAGEWNGPAVITERSDPCAKFRQRFKFMAISFWSQTWFPASPKNPVSVSQVIEDAISHAKEHGDC